MDTGTYSNILNAMQSLTGASAGKLTPAQEVENYSTFSDLQKQGVYLPDLMRKVGEVDELKKRLEAVETARTGPMDAELFAVMESAVKTVPSVKEARQRAADEKSRVLSEMCLRDEGYRKAVEDYRREVNRAYIAQKES